MPRTPLTLGSTTTIVPVIDSLVRTGEWYTVAAAVAANNVNDKPSVQNTALVNWTVAVDANCSSIVDPACKLNQALAIGATVSTSGIKGLSSPGSSALNALIFTDSTNDNVLGLGAAIESLTSGSDVQRQRSNLHHRPTMPRSKRPSLLRS